MKKVFWKADWFLGLVVALLFLAAGSSGLIQSLERKAYDMGVQMSSHSPSDKVAVIAIDDQSIANMGRWPWSREIHARMVDLLAAGGAKVVGNTILYLEPQVDPGLVHVNKISQHLGASPLKDSSDPAVQNEVRQLEALLQQAESSLNADRRLAESLRQANNVSLAMLFQPGQPHGNPDKPLPDYVARSALSNVKDGAGGGVPPRPTLAVAPPVADFGVAAAALGHLNVFADIDGGVRTEALVLRYYDKYFPSLSLMLAAKSLNLAPKDIEVRLGEGVKLGNLRIGTDPALNMHTYFYQGRDGKPAFPVDSFYDVYTGKIPAGKYKDRIVLLGTTAAGVGTFQVTPVAADMAPVLTMAHSVSSILKEHFFVIPGWAVWAELGVFLLVALYLILLMPRLGAGAAAGLSAAVIILLIGLHFGLMTSQGIWLQLMMPATFLLVGHVLITTKRFLVTERGKEKSEAESAESNRMLGLAFQGQGQLDMAWDKFRKCPLDDQIMDLLYNLALDFERKRQFNKAVAVFEYMAKHEADYKDLQERMKRSTQMSETVILGGTGGHPGGTMVLGGGAEKPMLGRYQVEKELGKGAMGVVYLGKDPKIGRVVAIKTMALSQEFEPDELEDVKARFFREAETAGRLNHPNIVTIYDAGEEHDLAYIAMEFLKGKDLVPYSKPGNLLPLTKVMSIMARIADALDYAHAQNVVHRDIKPANIMYEPESDTVKVTDFGIARITDSSRTKTGMVLGTPSYMSPEQLAGKKIDGRSDLFSFGVMFYQMVTGQLPFQGESMAQLMFCIANEPHKDPREINPGLPVCISAIINRLLTKNLEQRYQSGKEVATYIERCAASLKGASA